MNAEEDDALKREDATWAPSATMATHNDLHTLPTSGNDAPIEADSPSAHESPASNGNDSGSIAAESMVFHFEQENGRTYHRYRAGKYPFPNDVSEIDRLNFQYDMLKYAFSNRNYFAPLKDPKHILDIGTGTGQWAIEMGDEFPGAEVEATDLSPIQPDSVPANVHFYVDDASEDDWAVPAGHFDYIHTRILLGCFTDFREIIKKGFHYTKPGGYMECQEIASNPNCDDGTMPPNWPFLEWAQLIDNAANEAERPISIAHLLKQWYQEVGFVDVREEIFKIPMNTWPRDRQLKNVGRMMKENWLMGLNAFSMAYFSRVLGWNKTEIEVYLVNIRKCISDRNVHVYHKVHVVWGRKPFENEVIKAPGHCPQSAVQFHNLLSSSK